MALRIDLALRVVETRIARQQHLIAAVGLGLDLRRRVGDRLGRAVAGKLEDDEVAGLRLGGERLQSVEDRGARRRRRAARGTSLRAGRLSASTVMSAGWKPRRLSSRHIRTTSLFGPSSERIAFSSYRVTADHQREVARRGGLARNRQQDRQRGDEEPEADMFRGKLRYQRAERRKKAPERCRARYHAAT